MVFCDYIDVSATNAVKATVADMGDIGASVLGHQQTDDRRSHSVERAVFACSGQNVLIGRRDRAAQSNCGLVVALADQLAEGLDRQSTRDFAAAMATEAVRDDEECFTPFGLVEMCIGILIDMTDVADVRCSGDA